MNYCNLGRNVNLTESCNNNDIEQVKLSNTRKSIFTI